MRVDPEPEGRVARIQHRLPVTAVPAIPELRLHLAGPKSGLGRLLVDEGDAAAPYWAHVWSGGLVLARYLLDLPATVMDRDVLDLGCGSGLVAIAAARSGARAVTAVDVDPWAVAATHLNARVNGVTINAVEADLLDGPAPAVALLLLGDLFYDGALVGRLIPFLDRCRDTGITILVGDPGRKALPRDRLHPLRHIAAPDFASGRHDVQGGVYLYQSAARPRA